MATRPIFIATGDITNPFIQEDIDFTWVKGMSYKQKCKRRDSLRDEIAKLYDIKEWLEVSTKSDKDIGVKLSALNLMLTTKSQNKIAVEKVYQSSKVFEDGKIVKFKFFNDEFDADPYGMFYDYVYMTALYQNKDYVEEYIMYKIFSDIEFNPNKSINTQARATAIYKTFLMNNMIDIITKRDEFIKYYKENVKLKELK